MQRWKEHFADLFFNPSVVDEEVVDGLPQQDILHHMDCKPTNEEVVLAINSVYKRKKRALDTLRRVYIYLCTVSDSHGHYSEFPDHKSELKSSDVRDRVRVWPG